jgi:transforming growth factor-beta-induced protein
MKKIFRNFTFASAIFAAAIMGACSSDDDNVNDNGNGNGNGAQTIAEIAAGNEDFSILVDALTRTNLVDAVSDANASLTVFAPTNSAFTQLLADLNLSDLDALESALTTEGLANVLLYHVLGQKVMSNEVATGYASTLATNSAENNLSVFISTEVGVRLNGDANVTTADVEASNGVIHIIDRVITPQTIAGLVAPNSDFSNLIAAVTASDNDPIDILNDGSSSKTLFAPTNAAFGTLLADLNLPDLNAVVAAIGTDGIFTVLAYHLVGADVRAADVTPGDVSTLAGQDVNISIDGSGNVVLTDQENRTAIVTITDITATNGTVHIIDNVILPDLN